MDNSEENFQNGGNNKNPKDKENKDKDYYREDFKGIYKLNLNLKINLK